MKSPFHLRLLAWLLTATLVLEWVPDSWHLALHRHAHTEDAFHHDDIPGGGASIESQHHHCVHVDKSIPSAEAIVFYAGNTHAYLAESHPATQAPELPPAPAGKHLARGPPCGV